MRKDNAYHVFYNTDDLVDVESDTGAGGTEAFPQPRNVAKKFNLYENSM